MAESRYLNTPILRNEQMFGTQQDYIGIKSDVDNGVISTFQYMTKPLDRLDILANRFYSDGRYWWIIALTNDIGWGLQVPAGTILRIPHTSDSITDRL
ncbi:hypothetical protein CMI47_11870 [Candidatus Pacearchaeota archaeon]|nr:hypothetical protein [Candidatus Pacearchaeota archaeon]|tara:strand:- start:215 stop:508 length:294 start_codon:yes stop_codon:yes gene_type:complete